MDQASFLRLALVLSDGQAMTFKKNLLKLVNLVLFENYGQELTISEIIKKISEKYSLDFADNEIKSSIFSAPSGSIVETKPSTDPVYFTYSISPNEYEKLQGKIVGDALFPFIEQFLNENQSEDFLACAELEDVVCRFLYQQFNSDIQTVLALMNYSGEAKHWNLEVNGFSDKEILSLNAFLNWQNPSKNELIFKYVSFCYEYCVMTVKKDKAAFASIFKGKEFYLDANIIFRLAGFNKAERKDAVTAFLTKCRECGVKINYSNFTSAEINSTLEHHVDRIKYLLGGNAPISADAMQRLSSKYANLDFYAQYVEWTKQPRNKIGDYVGFLAYLKRQISKCTADMKFQAFETFDQLKTKEIFKEYSQDLTTFKSERNKGTYEGSIKVDVENYLLMQKLTKNSRSTNFFDEKYFFITADHAYIDWACEKMPGTIPLFVLPSVWYSIMLKYHGRTDNDYASFCQFLNQRISEPYDELQTQKTQMLACVLEMDESSEIKEEIIFDIGQRLSNGADIIDDVELFVEESHSRITEKKVAQAVQKAEETHRYEADKISREADKKANIKHAEGFEEGIAQGRNDILYGQAEQIVHRNKMIHVCLIVLAILSVLIIAAALIAQAHTGVGGAVPMLTAIGQNPIIPSIISAAFILLSALFSKLGKYISFFSTDIESVKEKLEKRVNRHRAKRK